MEFAVFSRRILTGTVSDLPPAIRIAWITVLFEAEKLRGKVKLPVRDLAKMASITTPEAAEALRVFQEPDPYSSSKEHDGRRLIPIAGEEDWYVVATWEKHAEERAQFFARLRQQRARQKQSKVTHSNGESRSVTVSHAPSRSVTKEPEPEPEPERKEETVPTAPSLPADGVAAADVVLRVADTVCPSACVDEISVSIWLRDINPDPWWIAAVICEGELTMKRARSANYVAAALRARKDESWTGDCEDLPGYVRFRMNQKGVTL